MNENITTYLYVGAAVILLVLLTRRGYSASGDAKVLQTESPQTLAFAAEQERLRYQTITDLIRLQLQDYQSQREQQTAQQALAAQREMARYLAEREAAERERDRQLQMQLAQYQYSLAQQQIQAQLQAQLALAQALRKSKGKGIASLISALTSAATQILPIVWR
jgi:hypothetical protein